MKCFLSIACSEALLWLIVDFLQPWAHLGLLQSFFGTYPKRNEHLNLRLTKYKHTFRSLSFPFVISSSK